MNREAVRDALYQVLQEIQVCSGRELCDMTEEMCPMMDLAGFSSVNGVEAAALLSAKLGYQIRPLVITAKYQDKHPTISQILDRLCPSDGT